MELIGDLNSWDTVAFSMDAKFFSWTASSYNSAFDISINYMLESLNLCFILCNKYAEKAGWRICRNIGRKSRRWNFVIKYYIGYNSGTRFEFLLIFKNFILVLKSLEASENFILPLDWLILTRSCRKFDLKKSDFFKIHDHCYVKMIKTPFFGKNYY